MLWKAEISLKGNLACIQTFFLQYLDTGPLWIPAFNLNRPPCLNKALLYHSYLSAYWKPVNAMSSSRLGSGKWVWIGSSQQMKAKAPEFPILRTPNTNSLTACRLCDDFFLMSWTLMCFAPILLFVLQPMQSAKPTHSGKLSRTQGGKLYNLGVLSAAQL